MNPDPATGDTEELEALFDSIISGCVEAPAPPPAAAPGEPAAPDVVARVGQMTRMLHETLRQLGYDRMLERAAEAIPDARDRLAYVATLTEQAATRALSAIEQAKPLQETLEAEADRLSGEWRRLFERQLTVAEFEQLVGATRSYLEQVPTHTRATREQLLEIMMAQDFQDLTGQVIKKIIDLAQTMERELVRLLVDLVPADKRERIDGGLVNGPVIDPANRNDVVTTQAQVDDLLDSLGF